MELAQGEVSPFERRVAEPLHVVKEKASAGAVRWHGCSAVFEIGEIFLDLLVRSFGFLFYRRQRSGHWHNFARIADVGHAAFNVFRFGGGDSVAFRTDEIDAGLIERDRLVTVIRNDDVDGHEAGRDVLDAEDFPFFPGIVRLGRNDDVLGSVSVVGRIGGGVLRRRHSVVGGSKDRRRGAKRESEGRTKTQAHTVRHDYHSPVGLA